MNSNANLWLNVLDKTKALVQNAECPDLPEGWRGNIFSRVEVMERMLDPNRHFSLAFAGMTNVGKSTLLNALLGDAVAPTRNCPWSSTAVEYRYSPDKFEIIVPLENFRMSHRRFDTSEELLDELNQFAVEGCAYQTDQPLVVMLPNDLLKGDVTIVDTPGFGATDGSSDRALHDEILLSYVKKREQNLRVFWIVKDNISEDSVAFFKKHLSKFCSDLIVNVTDEIDDLYIKAFEKEYKRKVGQSVRFHFVDAKTAVKAEKNQDAELLEKSGITELKSYLSSFSSPEARTCLVKDDLEQLYQDIADFLYRVNHFSIHWLPTTWGTLSSLVRKVDSPELYNRFLELKET